MELEKYINKVPVYVELDRPEEKAFALQRLYKQMLNVMDVIERGGLVNIKSDWDAPVGAASEILNRPNLKTVATSGSYNDLSDKPTEVSTFTNDAGYLTEHQSLENYYTKQQADNKFLTEHQSLENYYQKDESKDIAAIMSISTLSSAGVTTVTTNPEWQVVYTDNTDKILLGKRQDGTWYTPIPLSDVLNIIIEGLSAS